MTRDEAREAAKVLQHYADGGDVEYRNAHGGWSSDGPVFNFGVTAYRIKPKPAEGWATITGSDPNSLVGWASEKVARGAECNARRAIHWREVTE